MNDAQPAPVDDFEIAPETASLCLHALLDAVPAFVSFKDVNSRFIAVSRSKASRHGLEPEQLIGYSDADFHTKESAESSRLEETHVIETGEPCIRQLQKINWQDGREFWTISNRLPVRDPEGKIIGTMGISYDVTDQQKMAAELENTRRNLIDASRLAGMAEVATGVLHNVGNVLTSINVSANVLRSGLKNSKAESLGKLSDLLREHEPNLAVFISSDPKGRRVPEFIESLAKHMGDERSRLLNELNALQQNIDHVKEIITMQQAYATTAGVVESIDPVSLVEDAMRMNTAAMIRHSVSVVREFKPSPRVRAEKAKVIQVLVNLIRNAKYACDDSGGVEKIVSIRVEPGAPGRVNISVQDNGIGIPAENMDKLFTHGFTTRSNGHGFGLHSALRCATEMGGNLTAHSDGIGQGATFTLELPVADTPPPVT